MPLPAEAFAANFFVQSLENFAEIDRRPGFSTT